MITYFAQNYLFKSFHTRYYMALPMLVGGVDCGPSNPLQNLSKRFDQDRGIQQVRAGNHRMHEEYFDSLSRIILVLLEQGLRKRCVPRLYSPLPAPKFLDVCSPSDLKLPVEVQTKMPPSSSPPVPHPI